MCPLNPIKPRLHQTLFTVNDLTRSVQTDMHRRSGYRLIRSKNWCQTAEWLRLLSQPQNEWNRRFTLFKKDWEPESPHWYFLSQQEQEDSLVMWCKAKNEPVTQKETQLQHKRMTTTSENLNLTPFPWQFYRRAATSVCYFPSARFRCDNEPTLKSHQLTDSHAQRVCVSLIIGSLMDLVADFMHAGGRSVVVLTCEAYECSWQPSTQACDERRLISGVGWLLFFFFLNN